MPRTSGGVHGGAQAQLSRTIALGLPIGGRAQRWAGLIRRPHSRAIDHPPRGRAHCVAPSWRAKINTRAPIWPISGAVRNSKRNNKAASLRAARVLLIDQVAKVAPRRRAPRRRSVVGGRRARANAGANRAATMAPLRTQSGRAFRWQTRIACADRYRGAARRGR